ncbi:MAG: biotin/lipoyl-containing protein [bacterium]
MGQYILTIKNKDYKVDVKKIEGMLAEIEIDGKALTVHIKQLGVKKEPANRPVRKSRPVVEQVVRQDIAVDQPKSSSKTVKVTAPIPGVVLKIVVSEGDAVKAGQDLLVMEAMKMENQIQAPRTGKIAKIHVKREDAVQQDQILVEIEPS